MNAIAIPKGWRLLRNGTRERPTDRFRFRTEGGDTLLRRWSPIGAAVYRPSVGFGRVRQMYLTIRKDA